MTNNYEQKYLKYKEKYLELKNQFGSGTPRPEMSENEFEVLLNQVRQGETEAVLAAVNQNERLVTRTGLWDKRTLLQRTNNVELARVLLARGASVGARDWEGKTATYWASYRGNVALVTLLLDHGGDVNTSADNGWTALAIAASYGHLAVCLLLLARGANLKFISRKGETVLDLYGDTLRGLNYGRPPPLSPEVLAEHRNALLAAWRAGPHPSQRWARRLPMMSFVAGCRFRPLAGKQGWIPPEGLSLEQRERARRRILVFSSDVLLRLIVSFL